MLEFCILQMLLSDRLPRPLSWPKERFLLAQFRSCVFPWTNQLRPKVVGTSTVPTLTPYCLSYWFVVHIAPIMSWNLLISIVCLPDCHRRSILTCSPPKQYFSRKSCSINTCELKHHKPSQKSSHMWNSWAIKNHTLEKITVRNEKDVDIKLFPI